MFHIVLVRLIAILSQSSGILGSDFDISLLPRNFGLFLHSDCHYEVSGYAFVHFKLRLLYGGLDKSEVVKWFAVALKEQFSILNL